MCEENGISREEEGLWEIQEYGMRVSIKPQQWHLCDIQLAEISCISNAEKPERKNM